MGSRQLKTIYINYHVVWGFSSPVSRYILRDYGTVSYKGNPWTSKEKRSLTKMNVANQFLWWEELRKCFRSTRCFASNILSSHQIPQHSSRAEVAVGGGKEEIFFLSNVRNTSCSIQDTIKVVRELQTSWHIDGHKTFIALVWGSPENRDRATLSQAKLCLIL